MPIRAVLVGMSIAAVLLAVSFGPALYTTITGRPFFLDCGDASPQQCEEALHVYSAIQFPRQARFGPVIYFTFEPNYPEGTCGEWSVTRGWFTFGTRGWAAQPFC